MTPSENRPHKVVRRGATHGVQYPSFQAAHAVWRRMSTWQEPYDIVTCETGRVIDPGTPVVDVNE